MLSILMARLRQGHRTASYPRLPPVLPERFRGRPVLDPDACAAGCRECDGVCPTGALVAGRGRLTLDLGRCLFCGECARRCTRGAIRFTRDHQLAARRREDLTLDGKEVRLAAALDEKSRRLFGRSLKLRQVSAGGCNACESDCNVLNTLVFDLGRFGIQFVASPRHADGRGFRADGSSQNGRSGRTMREVSTQGGGGARCRGAAELSVSPGGSESED